MRFDPDAVVVPPLEADAHRRRFATQAGVVALLSFVFDLALQRFEPFPPDKSVIADEVWYVRVAHSVVEGRGFTWFGHEQTALHGPLTVFLLLPAALVQPYGYTAQRATIAILGALTVLTVAYVGRELGGPRVGVIAAVVAAVYPGLWVNDMVATSETPALLLLALMVLAVLRYRRDHRVGTLVALGILAGLLALDRAELALLAVLLVVPALATVARRDGSPAKVVVRGLLIVGVLAIAVITPWSAYNAGRFQHTVLISNNLGQTLVGANCPAAYYGPLTGFNGPPDGSDCYAPVLRREIRSHPHGDESTADAYFRHAAVSYAVAHWHRWPIVVVMRELWLWSLWRPAWTVYIAGVYIGRAQWAAWSQVVGFWLMAPLAIYGFFVARRRRALRWPLVMLVVFTALLGGVVVGNLRYRIPADLAFVFLAAFAIDEVLAWRTRGAPATAAAAADAVVDAER